MEALHSIRNRGIETVRQREITELVQHSVHSESTLRWNGATSNIKGMVWQYFSPVFSGGDGWGIFSFPIQDTT